MPAMPSPILSLYAGESDQIVGGSLTLGTICYLYCRLWAGHPGKGKGQGLSRYPPMSCNVEENLLSDYRAS